MPLVVIPELPITQKNFAYWYKGTIQRVVDGDSYHIDLDLGCRMFRDGYECRGYGYDTWETRRRPSGITDAEWEEHKRKGKAATAYIESIMPAGTMVAVNTYRDEEGKYGRLLVRVYIHGPEGWIDVAESLKANGHLKG